MSRCNTCSNETEMALVVAPAPRDLLSFKGDCTAKTREFFDAFAEDLGGRNGEMVAQVGEDFVETHRRTRLANLFELTTSVALAIVSKAGGDEDLVGSIEDTAGFKFRQPDAPDSFALMKLKNGMPLGNANYNKLNTVSAKMTSEEMQKMTLSQGCFDVFTTPDYENNQVEEREVEAFTDACLQHFMYEHGTWKIGKPLVRKYMAGPAKRIMLPDYGKGPGRKLGKDRDLVQMTIDKIKNRKSVRLAPFECPPHSSLLSPPTPLSYSQFMNVICCVQKKYNKRIMLDPSKMSDEKQMAFLTELGGSKQHAITIDEDADSFSLDAHDPETKPKVSHDDLFGEGDAAGDASTTTRGSIVFGEAHPHLPSADDPDEYLFQKSSNPKPDPPKPDPPKPDPPSADISAKQQLEIAKARLAQEAAEVKAKSAAEKAAKAAEAKAAKEASEVKAAKAQKVLSVEESARIEAIFQGRVVRIPLAHRPRAPPSPPQ